MNYNTIFKGKHLNIIRPINMDYEIMHEQDGIIVMPIVITKSGMYTIIRKEFIPPYTMKNPAYEHWYTVISETLNQGERTEDGMVRALVEEAGMKPLDYDILFKKENMPVYKGSDRFHSLYVVHIKSFDMFPPTPDGSIGESKSCSLVININKLLEFIERPNVDYSLYSMYHILMNTIRKNFRI